MKKASWTGLLCLVLTVLLLGVSALAAGETALTVTAPETLPSVGEMFTVSVDLSGNSGFAAVQMTLQSNPAVVQCVDVDTGTLLRGMMSASNPSASSGAIVAAASATGVSGDGNIATFTYRVVGNGDAGFKVSDLVLSDENGKNLDFSVKNVPVVAPPGKEESQPPTREPAQGSGPADGEIGPPAKEGTTVPEKTPEQPKEPEKTPEKVIVSTPEKPAATFTDTAGHWAEGFIANAVERGFFQGYADGSFRPASPVTRGAFVTVLWRMAGRPQPTGETPFTDLSGLSPEFQTAIRWAYQRGLVGGRTATTFAPGDSVTRQAAMKILFAYSGGQSGPEVLFIPTYRAHFADSAALPDQFAAPMFWGVYNGLISGTADGQLSGGLGANRAQLAKILTIFDDKVKGMIE